MAKSTFLLIVSLLFAAAHFASAQRAIDSLEKEFKRPLGDSLKIKTLIALSEEYQYIDFNNSIQLANEAVELATKKNWNWALSIGLERKSYLSSINGDFLSAIIFDQDLLKLAINKGDSSKLADCLNFLGFDYQELGEFDEAYYYFSQTYRISNALHDSSKIARAYLNLGSVFKELGQFEQALEYLKLSGKISSLLKDQSGEPYILDEEGDIYQSRGQLEKAKGILLHALKLTRQQRQLILEPNIFKKLALVALKQNKFKEAISYYDSANSVYSKSNNKYGLSQVKLGLGEIFLKQEKLDSALGFIEESRTIAKNINAKNAEAACLTLLAELAERKKDFEKALLYYKSAKKLSDSLVSQETLTRAFQNQLRFETENRDTEIAELTSFKYQQLRAMKQEEFVRNILVVAIALTAIVLFTVYRSGQRRLRINRLLLDHQEEIKQRAIELEQLNKVKDKFFSIISHDLRSPINSLSAILSLMENKSLTNEEFNRLAKELRIQFSTTKTLINNLLDWALLQMDKLKIQPESVNLCDLANQNYALLSSLHLKEVKFINRINETHVGFVDTNMINLVFRNLIMNSLKFTETGGEITSDSFDMGSHYEICIGDNGVGMSEEVKNTIFEKPIGYSTRGTANEKGTGLGLILCKEFVERNGGKIRVESELGKGSKFYFTVLKSSK
jgi:signal transduction histidine kinase